MPVETQVTYISDLNPAFPAHDDGLSQADTHLREIKQAIIGTFTGITGVVTATQSDLNSTTGLAARVTAVEGNRLLNNADQTLTGSLTVSSTLNAALIQQGGNKLIPSGLICAWYGNINTPPPGWLVCNGANGTPDLRDRFVVGAGNSYALGQTGGAAAQNPTTSAAGLHNHGGTQPAGAHTHNAYADLQGQHTHGGVTGGHSITSTELPPHYAVTDQGGVAIGSNTGNGFYVVADGSGYAHNHGIAADGQHTHNLSVSFVDNHAHALNSDGQHTHTLSFDNRPPFYALVFIIKT